MTQINRLDPARSAEWNRFVMAHDAASFFHRAEWFDVLKRAFGHQPHYLFIERNGAIAAILPLFHIRSLLFGNALISVPFCVYGGVVGDSSEDRALLIREAQVLARRLGVDYLELRNEHKVEEGWKTKDLYVTFRKTIFADTDENLKSIPRKQRAMVRKGIKGGLESHLDDGIDAFYRCFSESVRNLGTPVFSKKYFSLLFEAFGDDCEVRLISKDGQVIAGVMNFYFKNQVLPYYGGGIQAARRLYANDFMYWEVMDHAAQRGVEIFDYGRSKVGSGSYRFKKHWGFEPQPLAYSYHLVKSQEVPNISPNNAKYKYFVDAWRRLPLGVANRLGPWLSRQLG